MILTLPHRFKNDVEEGKYDPKPDDYILKVVDEPNIISSFKTQDRITRSGLLEKSRLERAEYENTHYNKSDKHLPARQKPKPKRESVRFDKAV